MFFNNKILNTNSPQRSFASVYFFFLILIRQKAYKNSHFGSDLAEKNEKSSPKVTFSGSGAVQIQFFCPNTMVF